MEAVLRHWRTRALRAMLDTLTGGPATAGELAALLPIARPGDTNEGAPDDQQRTWEHPHPGPPAIRRRHRRRADGGPLRHRHRRRVVGTHRSPAPGPLARRGRGRPAPRR